MHELALMDSVLNIVRDSASSRNIKRVHIIKLIVGEFSMAVPDSLRFAFEALAQGELFQDAGLVLELRALSCRCRQCEQEYQPIDHYDLVCPYCGSHSADIIAGRELQIDYFEGD